MKIFKDKKSIKEELSKYHNKTIGFIPTMGSLHEGHLSLIRKAKSECDIIVVSIFVNQKQFNNENDYQLYPKNLDEDINKIADIVDILFCPNHDEIYSKNFTTKISVIELCKNLCGATRKGHFDGVCIVVAKLFNIIKPQKAFFGEKDFQQLQIIRRLSSDLELGVRVIGCEIIRQKNGLAMSSRNLLLNEDEQKISFQIYQNLLLAKKQIIAGDPIKLVLEQIGYNLTNVGFNKIDYIQVCDEQNLQPIIEFDPKIKSRLFIAIYLGEVRLIDNVELDIIR